MADAISFVRKLENASSVYQTALSGRHVHRDLLIVLCCVCTCYAAFWKGGRQQQQQQQQQQQHDFSQGIQSAPSGRRFVSLAVPATGAEPTPPLENPFEDVVVHDLIGGFVTDGPGPRRQVRRTYRRRGF